MSDKNKAAVPAATATIVRERDKTLEVLLLRRHEKMVYGPGAWVFPGGKVEASDKLGKESEILSAKRAAIRETQEEAGITLDQDELVFFSHWLTPPGYARCFTTWFFVAALNDDQDVCIDNNEISDYMWITPEKAVAAYNEKTMHIMPPTFVTLWQLEALGSVERVLTTFKGQDPFYYKPKVVNYNNEKVSIYAGDHGYEQGVLSQQGAMHRLWYVNQKWRYENTLNQHD